MTCPECCHSYPLEHKDELVTPHPTLKEKQLKLLVETSEHFNSGNRSVSKYNNLCTYGGVGCAIGRLILEKSLCDELDKMGDTSVYNKRIFDLLPLYLRELGEDFLGAIQDLHDNKLHWANDGMSEAGRLRFAEIKRKIKQGFYEIHKTTSHD